MISGGGRKKRTVGVRGKRRNVMLVLADSLRADHLGCYGYERPTSPNIDALASKGTMFRNAFTHAPFTHSSVVTFLSSQYPSYHGILKAEDLIDEGITLFPQLLQKAGVRTGAFTANPNVNDRSGHNRGFDHFYQGKGLSAGPRRFIRRRLGWREDVMGDKCERMNQRIIEYLDTVGGEQFFIFAFYIDTHSPFRPPARYIHRFSKNFVPFYDRKRIVLPKIYKGYSDKDLEEIVARYDADINYWDDNFRTVLDHLESRGLLDDTLIIFSADHGEGFRFQSDGHGQVYEDGIHIPLIFRGPGIPRGREVDGMVGAVDIAPTILDYMGIEIPKEFRGRSLKPMLRDGEGEKGRKFILIEFTKSSAIRTEKWKFISNRMGLDSDDRTNYFRNWDAKPPEELYDLEKDPGEEYNVVDEFPEVARRYRKKLKEEIAIAKKDKGTTSHYQLDQETMERLRGLGYM